MSAGEEKDSSYFFRALGAWKNHVASVPRRLSWVIHGFIFFCLTGGIGSGIAVAKQSFENMKDVRIDELPTYGEAWNAISIAAAPLGWLIVCFIAAFIYSMVLHNYIAKEVVPLPPSRDDRKRFLLQGIEGVGLRDVYRTDKNIAIQEQEYSDKILAEMSKAGRVRILSIAGYQYVGRGSDSLLYNAIKSHPNIDFEIILTKPNCAEGKKIIEKRISQLKQRDSSFTYEKLVREIEETITSVQGLSSGRNGECKVLTAKDSPVFRMLFIDNSLWISAYEDALHGHESTLYRLVKDGDKGWFPAFEAFYMQVRSRSEPI